MFRLSACAAICISFVYSSAFGWFGFTRNAITVALGTHSRNNSSRLAPSAPVKKLTPVALPPGRLRLATRPSLTGSSALVKRLGGKSRKTGSGATRHDDRHLTANEIGSERRQSIEPSFRPAVFDGYILPLDKASFFEALAECSHEWLVHVG